MKLATATLLTAIAVLGPTPDAVADDGPAEGEEAPAAGEGIPAGEGEAPAAGEAVPSGEEAPAVGERTPETASSTDGEADDGGPSREELLGMVEDLSARVEALELADLEAGAAAEASRLLEIYGFFDIGMVKFFVEEGSMFDGLINDNPSFIMQHLNLYFASQMSETWSALVELRFSFLPHGQETSFDTGLTGYERVDTSLEDPYSNERLRMGGMMIERAHVTWQPVDWFGVLAGRYLTPYGIWNVDHGSPVLIPVRPPLLQVHQWIPSAQTGVQVFGRFFPGENVFLDYAVTASNGRGPMDTVFDLDNDKGLGLRAKLTYDDRKVLFSLGGYGYTGEYTDISKSAVVVPEFRVTASTEESYREVSGAADILFEAGGFRLQSEFVRGRIYYDVRPRRSEYRGGGNQPDYVFTDVYGLVAYALPTGDLLGGLIVTPYLLYEYSIMDDTLPDLEGHVLVGGLNLKPTPFVAIKGEYSYKLTPADRDNDFSVISLQLAVSF